MGDSRGGGGQEGRVSSSPPAESGAAVSDLVLASLTDGGQLLEVQAGAGLTQQIQPVVEQLGAGGRVQVLQLLHRDLGLHVDDAQDERRVLDLQGERRRVKLFD